MRERHNEFVVGYDTELMVTESPLNAPIRLSYCSIVATSPSFVMHSRPVSAPLRARRSGQFGALARHRKESEPPAIVSHSPA